MVYIRQRNLPKLHEYKYAGVDKSLVSKYILKPFYTNVVIKCFPMSMAPNLITLTGFGFVIINLLTMLWYNPSLDQDMPPWVYLSFSIGLFLYQTFDAVDGTQARRTHQSGPLGELFDHGVDACNTSLEVLLFASAMNLGQSWHTVLTLFGAIFTFYIQTWDEYHTHQLTLGIVSGPVEGVLTLIIVYFVTFLKGGGSYWQQPMLPTLGLPKSVLPDSFYQSTWAEWYIFYGGAVLVFNTASSILNVMEARRSRGQDPIKPLLGLLPVVVSWTLIPAYLWLNPIILRQHLVPFALFAGLLNAYSVGQMIVRHLVKDKFPYKNVLIPPLAWAVLDSAGPLFGLWPSALGPDTYQVAFVFMMTGLAFGVYGSFVHDVITTICDYLDIWCLTIKHPYVEGKEDGDAKKSKSVTDTEEQGQFPVTESDDILPTDKRRSPTTTIRECATAAAQFSTTVQLPRRLGSIVPEPNIRASEPNNPHFLSSAMAPATHSEAPADSHIQISGGEDENAESKGFDPATYSGLILPAGGNAVSWGGRTTYQEPRPDGNRYAQSQWQFTMSGALGHEAPHAAYLAMSSEQRTTFDKPGRLPFHLFGPGSGTPGTLGGGDGGAPPEPQPAIEAPPPPPPAAPPACSQCSASSSSIKKIRTHGGLMRSLCNNCVYDMAGGDQDEFSRRWADGCPL